MWLFFQGTSYRQTNLFEEADFVYIPIPHIDGIDQENPDVFLKEVQKIASKGIPVLCANPDQTAHEGQPPRLVVRQGTIARMLQRQGAIVHFIGKPFSAVFQEALQLFPESVQPEQVLMIGDTSETDIRGAREMGMRAALVTKTGIMKERIQEKGIAAAIQELSQEDQPNHFIEAFAIHDF